MSCGSYKFHRMFPLSQYDLPTHTDNVLSFPAPLCNTKPTVMHTKSTVRSVLITPTSSLTANTTRGTLNEEQLSRNPEVDYTKWAVFRLSLQLLSIFLHIRPELITLVFSDIGILTPDGVSQYLVGMFAG